MKLLALHKAIKKPPRSDERDGELFCGTELAVVNSGTLGTGASVSFNNAIGHYVVFFAYSNDLRSVIGMTLIIKQMSTTTAFSSIYKITESVAQIVANGGAGFIEFTID